MTTQNAWICAAAIGIAAGISGAASAQGWGSAPPEGIAAFQTYFGGAGLLTEWSSAETYGVVQSRVNLQYAHQSAANGSGILTGYQDETRSLVIPVSGMWTLSDKKSFIWANASLTLGKGAENPTYSDPSLGSLTVEYLRMVSPETVWGVGVVMEGGSTDLRHNGGSVDSPAMGLRADVMHRFSATWGIALRALAMDGETRTTIPLGFTDLKIEQDRRRYYFQADLVGKFTSKELAFLPEGWVMNPVIGVAMQRTDRAATTTSLGAPVAAESDSYGVLSTSLRFSKPAFQPGKWAPSVEVGVDHEFSNDLGDYSDESTYLYTKIGAGILLDKSTFLNISYGRSDGLNGNRSSQAVTVVFSKNF